MIINPVVNMRPHPAANPHEGLSYKEVPTPTPEEEISRACCEMFQGQNCACCEKCFKDNKHNSIHLARKCICSSKLTVILELRSQKTVRFSEQIMYMSADKYPSISWLRKIAVTWIFQIFARVFAYLPSFFSQILNFIYLPVLILFWSILNGVTLKRASIWLKTEYAQILSLHIICSW